MKRLLNTLYVMTPESYLSLENGNIVVNLAEKVLGRVPLHTLEQIIYFGYKGASPALLGECASNGIGLSFYSSSGRFLARTAGIMQGNVLLRREQYRIADVEERSCSIARNFIAAKIFNSRSVITRCLRDHPLSIDTEKMADVSENLMSACRLAKNAVNSETLRGIEGESAALYFSVFDQLILQNKKFFSFAARHRRPPTDPVNAMLSFSYTILANDCISALAGAGLDPYVGFLHRDRPGRQSLALDLLEELRSVYADRFVLTLINNRMVKEKSFLRQENGAILLTEDARKKFFEEWQEKKREQITHPFLKEKMPWGLVPHIQSQLLARFIRGDIDEYPSFLWK